MSTRDFTRRSLAWIVAALLGVPTTRVLGQTRTDVKGIGGTGATTDPDEKERDRGIGGTGVVGTIRGFGSIVVNGLRIAYPKTARVTIDGVPASAKDLRVGHVVHVRAKKGRAGFSTQAIAVMSEVVGPLDEQGPDGLVVFGQSVVGPQSKVVTWPIGATLAVSGIRRADGVIVASLVESRRGSEVQVIGPVVAGRDAVPTIGRLALPGTDRALVGRRCLVKGRLESGKVAIQTIQDERPLLLAGLPDRLLIEAYVATVDDAFSLGSGLPVSGKPGGLTASEPGGVHAVVTASVGPNGNLAVESVRTDGQSGETRSPARNLGRRSSGPISRGPDGADAAPQSRSSPRGRGEGGSGRGGPGHR